MSRPDILKTPILLASGSPRRKLLLENAGFHIRVHPVDVDESFDSSMPVKEVPIYLAKKKAKAALSKARNGELVLAADSIVVIDGLILGKPSDKSDAFNMLSILSGKEHQVMTGCFLARDLATHSFLTISRVYLYELTDLEIRFYIDKYDPLDKAGAYGIQDWMGWCKVARIEGSYTNIMGLPVSEIYHAIGNNLSVKDVRPEIH